MRDFFSSIFKLILAVFILPLMIACSVSFSRQILIEDKFANAMIWGFGSYLIMHLFIVAPKGLFNFHKKMMGDLFKFYLPLSTVMPYLLPLYSTLLFVAFYFVKMFWHQNQTELILVYFIGFFFTMHIILIAQDLYENDSSSLKPTYFLGIGLAYILNIVIFLGILALVLPQFPLKAFFQNFFHISKDIYKAASQQLFGLYLKNFLERRD